MLEHKTRLKKLKKAEIILSIFSNYNTSVAAQPWSHGLTGPSPGQSLAREEPSIFCSLLSQAHALGLECLLCSIREFTIIRG